MNFLEPEESKEVASRYPDHEFVFWYWETVSGLRIKPKDYDWDYLGIYKHDLICPAVPSNFEDTIKGKEKKSQRIESILEEKQLTPEEKLRKNFDDIAEEAFLFGAEDFDKNAFLPMEVCFNMKLLGIINNEITGWAYYNRIMKASEGEKQKSKKKSTAAPVLRPLVEPSRMENKVFYYQEITPAFSKKAFPRLDSETLSSYRVKMMRPEDIKAVISNVLKNKEYYESVKLRSVTGNGIKRENVIFFISKNRGLINSIKNILDKEDLSVQIDKYTEVIDDKNVMTEELAEALKERLDTLTGFSQSEFKPVSLNIKDGDYPKTEF